MEISHVHHVRSFAITIVNLIYGLNPNQFPAASSCFDALAVHSSHKTTKARRSLSFAKAVQRELLAQSLSDQMLLTLG